MADEIEGEVMFYRSPEPLSAEKHGHLRVKTAAKPFGFAAAEPTVPLTVGEFIEAAADYPIIFIGQNRFPGAVLGMPSGGNLYIGEDGLYEQGVYIPAFIRRYPLVAAGDPANPNAITACIDVAAENVNAAEGEPLFENGQPSAFTLRGVNFLERFQSAVLATETIVALYAELDLFEAATFELGVGAAERKPIFNYQRLSAAKLNALTAEQLDRLHQAGALAPAFAHLVSMNKWSQILLRAMNRGQVTAATETESLDRTRH